MTAANEIYLLSHRIMKATGHASAVPFMRLARQHEASFQPIAWLSSELHFRHSNPLRVRLTMLWKCWKASKRGKRHD
jgi:hypothetical protein